MIKFLITAKMHELCGGFIGDSVDAFLLKPAGAELEIHCSSFAARELITHFTKIVNARAAFGNTDPDHTSALAAVKRIRKALGQTGTLEGTALSNDDDAREP